MKQQLFLHEIVKSLTKNEKGYFVQHLTERNKLYGKLFQIIDSQDVYNEKKVKENFNGTYIGRNFSFAKNYLYHSILKSLIQYNASKKDAYYYFSSVKILYQKGLYVQCAKMLKQIVKRALEYDDYLSILRVIQYIKLLAHSNLHSDQYLLDLVAQEADILQKQQTVSTFQTLLVEVKNVRLKKGGLKEQDSMERLEQIRRQTLLQSEMGLIDKYCEHMFHEILFLCGFLMQDEALTERHIRPLQNMIVDSDYFKNINGYRKIDILKQLIRYNILKQNFDSAQSNITALRDLLISSTDINKSELVAAYSYLYSFQTDLLLNRKELDHAEILFEEIEEFSQKNKGIIPAEFNIVITGNILVLRFMMGDYREVLKLTNELLTGFTKEIRKDIVISTMLGEIAVLYELGKHELLESRLHSFYRYLSVNRVHETTWKIFADYFKNVLAGKDSNKEINKLLERVDKLGSNRIVLDLEFLVDWARKKAQRKQ